MVPVLPLHLLKTPLRSICMLDYFLKDSLCQKIQTEYVTPFLLNISGSLLPVRDADCPESPSSCLLPPEAPVHSPSSHVAQSSVFLQLAHAQRSSLPICLGHLGYYPDGFIFLKKIFSSSEEICCLL